jgi:DNA-binding NtrC family response regulator
MSEWMAREKFEFRLIENFKDVLPVLSGERFEVVVPTNMWLSPHEIPELVTRLGQGFPGVGILVISGWTEIEEDVSTRGAQFLSAPFPLEEFSRRIRKIIAKQRTLAVRNSFSLQ